MTIDISPYFKPGDLCIFHTKPSSYTRGGFVENLFDTGISFPFPVGTHLMFLSLSKLSTEYDKQEFRKRCEAAHRSFPHDYRESYVVTFLNLNNQKKCYFKFHTPDLELYVLNRLRDYFKHI